MKIQKEESSIIFPDPNSAGEDGLLCVGGDLRVETLISAYSQGIFPWPQEGLPLLWFSPANRGVIEFKDLHWPRRFLRELRSSEFTVTFNKNFSEVIQGCAQVPRKHEKGTWILPPMEGAYARFHRAGFAHSVECWHEEKLVGGLYGVYVNGVFSGESMFHLEPGASKRCLYALTQCLMSHGLKWMDIQMVTPVTETFGGRYISRSEFQQWIRAAQQNPVRIDFSSEACS